MDIFSYIKENDRDSPPELMRINNTSHAVELITDKVDGYSYSDNIWVFKRWKKYRYLQHLKMAKIYRKNII